MAVHKNKKSKSRSKMRKAANMKITFKNLSKCPSCGVSKQSHRVCLKCGFYKDKTILDVARFSHKYKFI